MWLLNKVREAVLKIKTEGNTIRRLTKGYIANVAGIPVDELKCIKTKPLTRTFLEDVIESEEDWYRRRIISAYDRIIADGASFSPANLRRHVRIHPYTYLKYQEMIDGVIKELGQTNK